jgi:hypothetical protein
VSINTRIFEIPFHAPVRGENGKLRIMFQKFSNFANRMFHWLTNIERNNNNKHTYAGATDKFTNLRVLLVLTERGTLTQAN